MASAVKMPLQSVADDLERIFRNRFKALVAYGWRTQKYQPSLALVDALTLDDLTVCAARTAHWHRAGCATPLLLTPYEFARSLDAFPIEYDEIIATSRVVYGDHPFEGLAISPEDLRRACEVQVKSHLVHLREDYLETGGKPANVAALTRESAPAFVALLRKLARLDHAPTTTTGELIAYAARRIHLDERLMGDLLALAEPDVVAHVDPGRIFPAYLEAVERLAEFVDQWRRK